jgi:hypothetical protein
MLMRMTDTPGVRAAWMGLVCLLFACSRTSAGERAAPKEPAAACVKDGDNCEYAPGKLGLCTVKTSGCDGGGSCFACMSLH